MEPPKTITRYADHTLRTVDERGRALLFRRPTALDALRLFKAAGPTLAQNEPWLAMASLAFAVEEIDGVPTPSPTNESQIESLVDRLGEQGLAAIAASINVADDKANLKTTAGNLPGTLS